MSIATTTQFWTSRMNGELPSALTGYGQDNDSFALTAGIGGDGSVVGNSFVISGSGQNWSITPTTTAYTMVACFKYGVTPADGTVLMKMDNGTHKVEVQSDGTDDKIKLVGNTTVLSSTGLDLKQQGSFEAKPIMLRLTLDAAGNAKLYIREIIEDDLGATQYLSVVGATGSSAAVLWGNTNGTITWNNVYVSTHGAFSPDELSTSPFVSDMLMRMAFSIVELLRNSNRFYLKNFIDNSSITYGYDVSSGMVSRLAPPTIHVVIRELTSPNFETLGGTRIDQRYKIILFITSRGTDYKNSYRTGLELMGDSFDEIYTNTGLQGNTDSLINYTASLDTKLDDDEVVCIHRIEFEYMRRLNMLHR